MAFISYGLLVLGYQLIWLPANDDTSEWLLLLATFIHSADRVLWVLAVIAVAARFLNRQSKHLSYLNDAVYPYYILHQSVIIFLGFELTSFSLGPILEPFLVIVGTFVICTLIYELIRPNRPFKAIVWFKNYRKLLADVNEVRQSHVDLIGADHWLRNRNLVIIEKKH